VYISIMLVALRVKPVEQLHRMLVRQPFYVFFSRLTWFFLFQEEESIDTLYGNCKILPEAKEYLQLGH
jgi:hypothetical protein